MLLGLLTAAASSSPSMYHQDKQQNYAASPTSSSPSSSSPSSPTYSPLSSPSASASSQSHSSASTSPSSHKLSAKAAAAGMYDFLSMKCQNRECSNVRGYPDKPNSIYCSSRCQSREQNLRQGRVKNVHKLPAALGVAKNQLKSQHASSAPSVVLPHNPSATPTNQFHNPHALSFSSPSSSAPAFQPPHPHSRSHHDLPPHHPHSHSHALSRSHYPLEEPRYAQPPFGLPPSSSSSSYPMNYHQHQQLHQSHGNHVAAHTIKSEPYPLSTDPFSHLHHPQQQQQRVHGSIYQHQEHQFFHHQQQHQQQNMGSHSVADNNNNPRGPHHLLPPPPHAHPFHALPPPLPLPQPYNRFPASTFPEPESPPPHTSVVSKEPQHGSRLGLLSLCIAADVEPSASSSPDDNDKEEKHSLSFILS